MIKIRTAICFVALVLHDIAWILSGREFLYSIRLMVFALIVSCLILLDYFDYLVKRLDSETND